MIFKIIDPQNYLFNHAGQTNAKGNIEHERLKAAIVRTNQGNVNNLAKLKQIMNTEIKLEQ